MKKLLWIDLEMTGLNVQRDVILEVAAVITDLDFNSLAEFHRVVLQPAEHLESMDEWCKKTHGESGLTAAVPNGTPLHQVESDLLKLLDSHFEKGDRIVLAGNSVSNDRVFIDRYMPGFSERLHYRIVDVSSFKEIFREKYSVEFKKKNTHRATDDIYESIEELRAYLQYITPPEGGVVLTSKTHGTGG